MDVAAGVFGDYPGSISDPGGAFAGRYTYWAARNSWVGADASVAGVLGGSESLAAHAGVSAGIGGTLFLLDWLAFEVDVGPYLGAQIDADNVAPTVGILGSGAYRFQFGRHTLRLAVTLAQAGVLADDPGNDCAMCSGFMLGGLGYDFRF
jgi:hypothetical protein